MDLTQKSKKDRALFYPGVIISTTFAVIAPIDDFFTHLMLVLLAPILIILIFDLKSNDPIFSIFRYEFALKSQSFDELERLFSKIKKDYSLFELKPADKIMIFHRVKEPNRFFIFGKYEENINKILNILENTIEGDLNIQNKSKISKLLYFKELIILKHFRPRSKSSLLLRRQIPLHVDKRDLSKLEEWKIKRGIDWEIDRTNDNFFIKPNIETVEEGFGPVSAPILREFIVKINDSSNKAIFFGSAFIHGGIVESGDFSKFFIRNIGEFWSKLLIFTQETNLASILLQSGQITEFDTDTIDIRYSTTNTECLKIEVM